MQSPEPRNGRNQKVGEPVMSRSNEKWLQHVRSKKVTKVSNGVKTHEEGVSK